eukprot:jgi/Chlat1/83/Chrsp1S08788
MRAVGGGGGVAAAATWAGCSSSSFGAASLPQSALGQAIPHKSSRSGRTHAELSLSSRPLRRCRRSGWASASCQQQQHISGSGSGSAIAVEDLTVSVGKGHGRRTIIQDCSLQVPKGCFWMLLGPNGCGKSTLLKTLASLIKPDAGRISLSGSYSFVFQNPDHQVVMPTAAVDVAFGLGAHQYPDAEIANRVEEALAAVGMSEYAQRPISTLSGGQKQRVAIAGALAERPDILLLDELTTYLDDADQATVLDSVKSLVTRKHVTALWITHRLEELKWADGAAYMENGKIQVYGHPAIVDRHIQQLQMASL